MLAFFHAKTALFIRVGRGKICNAPLESAHFLQFVADKFNYNSRRATLAIDGAVE